MARMLGRWRQGGCGCLIPGPDCAGHGRDTRWRKRIEQRQAAKEIEAESSVGRCPTQCDRDCAEPCHAVHAVAWRRDHDPAACAEDSVTTRSEEIACSTR